MEEMNTLKQSLGEINKDKSSTDLLPTTSEEATPSSSIGSQVTPTTKHTLKRSLGETNEHECLTDLSPTHSQLAIPSTSTIDEVSPSKSLKLTKMIERWDIPIHSITKKLLFMPIDPVGKNHIKKLNVYSQQNTLDNLKEIEIDLSQIIEKIDPVLDQEVAEILNRIFFACADSLERLIFRTPIGYLPGIELPVMENVVSLELMLCNVVPEINNFTNCLRDGNIFPKSFYFNFLPNLKEFIVYMEKEDSDTRFEANFDCWKNNLQSHGIGRSVKLIEYCDEIGFSPVYLQRTFPNALWIDNSSLEDD